MVKGVRVCIKKYINVNIALHRPSGVNGTDIKGLGKKSSQSGKIVSRQKCSRSTSIKQSLYAANTICR